MPQRYPFEPPKAQFVTPIYHPNIDSAGRICLDTLNLPPKGAWKPSLNISKVLLSLQLLMSEPNPEDGLMVDITHQYIHDHARFERTAIEQTRLHAMGSDAGGTVDAAALVSGAAGGTAGGTAGRTAGGTAGGTAGASSGGDASLEDVGSAEGAGGGAHAKRQRLD